MAKERQIDQNRAESAEIDPCLNGNVLYDKGHILNQWEKDGQCKRC